MTYCKHCNGTGFLPLSRDEYRAFLAPVECNFCNAINEIPHPSVKTLSQLEDEMYPKRNTA